MGLGSGEVTTALVKKLRVRHHALPLQLRPIDRPAHVLITDSSCILARAHHQRSLVSCLNHPLHHPVVHHYLQSHQNPLHSSLPSQADFRAFGIEY